MSTKFTNYIKNWFSVNKNKLYLVLLFVVNLLVLSKLPYLNLYLTPVFIVFLIIVLCTVIFKIRSKFIIITALVLLISTSILFVLRQFDETEIFGYLVYGILWLGVISNFLELDG